ncbi:hypothetical protein CEXT_597941 [Caerostris extrusa]|uniref:Uncharacterized protein n=1 Tax=Caerostris extrusa TaxID=172846 RepID=A0AAV4SWQ0_CAEEX|nr:hypothetical protein CEXT_597941 [Caerostris extrusa]
MDTSQSDLFPPDSQSIDGPFRGQVPPRAEVRGVRGRVQREALRGAGVQRVQWFLQEERPPEVGVPVPGRQRGVRGGQGPQEPVPGVQAQEVPQVRNEQGWYEQKKTILLFYV